jgi:hypothetical protein
MSQHYGADLWYFLNVFEGVGYILVVIFSMIWIRLLLMIIETALRPRKEFNHKFVHPLPDTAHLTKIGHGGNSYGPTTVDPSSSIKERRSLCA